MKNFRSDPSSLEMRKKFIESWIFTLLCSASKPLWGWVKLVSESIVFPLMSLMIICLWHLLFTVKISLYWQSLYHLGYLLKQMIPLKPWCYLDVHLFNVVHWWLHDVHELRKWSLRFSTCDIFWREAPNI